MRSLASRLTKQEQMSEALIVGLFLAFSGGFQDAYTYILRGNVFANAQTGNIVLMSTHFMKNEYLYALKYLVPLVAFALGVFIAEQIGFKFKYSKKVHWRQIVLLIEIIILFVVGFMPLKYNILANSLVSLACAMQVQAFRKVSGNAYATTMCIGNLRSGMAALSAFTRTRKRETLKKAAYYFIVIFIFAIGAGIGGTFSKDIGIHAIWISCAFLIVAIGLMAMEIRK
ncbi:YoaK family protein [Lachnospira multipara]|jgi:uncharacterized membrane protein YoaK (UPF0700 family)|uniref:YoaK family protein n=1 Tax=Lachnospira multipara TaxID=28051 RepID=UPI00041C74DA|nr:YoaK family protein [Lachnospira multipara]